jgi:acyl-CoA reductase-like NAD-dependent aldehyde dehydrogenase
LIVLEDANMELAVTLAAEGCYRNSGQRCTAVKRLLIHQRIVEEFTRRLVDKTSQYICGDPADEKTLVGTVIDEAAAVTLERRVQQAVDEGARLLCGGRRREAILEPTAQGTKTRPSIRPMAVAIVRTSSYPEPNQRTVHALEKPPRRHLRLIAKKFDTTDRRSR